MPGIKEIKKRVVSAGNTRKLTKALKMVSAVKLRRAQEAVLASRPYSKKIEELVSRLTNLGNLEKVPLLTGRDQLKNVLIVTLSSDRGKCGSFNSGICKFTDATVKDFERAGKTVRLWMVGTKGRDYFKSRGKNIFRTTDLNSLKISQVGAGQIADDLVEKYLTGEFDEIYLVYNQFKSAISQIPSLKKILPISMPTAQDENSVLPNSHDTFRTFFEPNPEEILNQLLPEALRMKVYQSMLESLASEHGARMSAMESATTNAGEMIRKLTLQYNKLRQAAITKEILEITSGAEALNG